MRRRSKPWKEIGYRGFSAFIASDNDFLIFRRFGSLNARLLLYLQDQIAVLEEKLGKLEEQHMLEEAKDIHHGSFRQEALPERTELLEAIHKKVRDYSKRISPGIVAVLTLTDELLTQHAALRTHPEVPERNRESIQNWFYNSQNAVLQEETAYIDKSHDLLQLVPKPTTPLRRILEKSTAFRLSKFWAKEPPGLPMHIAHMYNTHYTSDTRIDAFIGMIITASGTMMLIAPLWILESMSSPIYRLAVITVFIVLFLALVAFTMPSNPLGSLATAAAYSAVLVVFLQIGSSGGQANAASLGAGNG
jgi:hypothetical protein